MFKKLLVFAMTVFSLTAAAAVPAGAEETPQQNTGTISFGNQKASDPQTDLVIALTSAELTENANVVTGSITNEGSVSYRDISLEAVFSDASGQEMITVIVKSVEYDPVAPGDSIPFVISVYRNDAIADCVVNLVEAQVSEV